MTIGRIVKIENFIAWSLPRVLFKASSLRHSILFRYAQQQFAYAPIFNSLCRSPWSARTAAITSRPTTSDLQMAGTARIFMPLWIAAIINAATRVPKRFPRPPARLVPPITTTASTGNK